MFKRTFKASWIQVKQEAWNSWSICLSLSKYLIFYAVPWHILYQCALQFFKQCTTSPATRNCSFPLWAGVIINDNYSTIKTTWKVLLKRTGDTVLTALFPKHYQGFNMVYVAEESVIIYNGYSNVKEAGWLCTDNSACFITWGFSTHSL